ncbi:unnamed protein product, partial [Hapterophycus canaliculatus]
AWHAIKEYAKASYDYEAALRCQARFGTRWRHVAWFLATCPDATYRDGQRAKDLMKQERERREVVATVCLAIDAAAHAECGDFRSAIQLQNDYLRNVEKDREIGSASKLDIVIPDNALSRYQQSKPL